jgi:hypothetical protein
MTRTRFPATQVDKSADSRSADKRTLRFRKHIIGQHP